MRWFFYRASDILIRRKHINFVIISSRADFSRGRHYNVTPAVSLASTAGTRRDTTASTRTASTNYCCCCWWCWRWWRWRAVLRTQCITLPSWWPPAEMYEERITCPLPCEVTSKTRLRAAAAAAAANVCFRSRAELLRITWWWSFPRRAQQCGLLSFV